jgi:hypothetical protein
VRWCRLSFASFVIGAVGCASVIGIEDTTDEVLGPERDGSITADDVVIGDGPISTEGDDAASSTEVPVVEDAATLADVETIDARVPTCAEAGLVARWKIDEGTGTIVTDCSGNALHGVATNGTWTSNGADGGALKFSGNGWVGFANPALLRITGAFTISLWIRADTNATGTEYIFGKTSDPAQNGYRLGLIDSPRQLALATPSSASYFNVVGGTVPIGSWRHVAAVYRPSVATELYLSGTKVGTHTSAPSALVASNAEARLAARKDGLYGFNGAISDVRVYDRALSASEITALAQR